MIWLWPGLCNGGCSSPGLLAQEESGGWNPGGPLPVKPATWLRASSPLQPRGKGIVFSDPPVLPQAVYPRTASATRPPSNSSQSHSGGQQQFWWKRLEVASTSLHFSNKGKKPHVSLSYHPGLTETGQPFFPRCHQEYMLACSLAQKPNTLSSLCIGLHSSQGLSYFPGVKWSIQSGLSGSWAPGGHSVLGRRKTLNMSLEYFSHFKKGYGSRECPPAALRWAPRWASRLAGVPKWLAETNYGQSSSSEKGKQDQLTSTRTCTVFL